MIIEMSTEHLSRDEFFDKLVELFNRRRGTDHGAIYLVQKRFSFGQAKLSDNNMLTHEDGGGPKPLIIRATNGKSKRQRDLKVKMSTIVQPNDIESFYVQYADVCKAGMAALKPRDRSKKKAKAKKKKTTS
ncbi:hypothetical protein C2857_003027 [Epichloe festucae Fl1]|uniref:Signal recognition particle subunit SRP14 n=1 Tax=Epichloe festucae (strain Fl1) TaxID=877507 RepID=A0A7S9PRT9_EPIFF|nr:hypothetical protein C2857_003027 [Epichloe festucae Fl1]